MKYYLIAGEASGDLHAANLVKELKILDQEAQFRAWGGDLMEAQGVSIQKHYRDLAFMGFTEVLQNIRTILRNFKICIADIEQWQPDVVILIDYPGFNLRIAEKLKGKGIKIFYYISPQVWAWKKSRVKKIKKYVDKMFVILPFEKKFYDQYNFEVEFVGHPLLDAIQNLPSINHETFCKEYHLENKPIIALLPGSRKQEVKTMLPVMLDMIPRFPEYQFVIAGAPSLNKSFYEEVSHSNSCPVIFNATYSLLRMASAGLVTSGTATLEAALLDMPEVVCYKGGRISYWIARSLIKVKYISLVNLIMNREVVKELIQNEFTRANLEMELKSILPTGPNHNKLKRDYELLRLTLGGNGASRITAISMLKTLQQSA